jgi:hypothetical protein
MVQLAIASSRAEHRRHYKIGYTPEPGNIPSSVLMRIYCPQTIPARLSKLA